MCFRDVTLFYSFKLLKKDRIQLSAKKKKKNDLNKKQEAIQKNKKKERNIDRPWHLNFDAVLVLKVMN